MNKRRDNTTDFTEIKRIEVNYNKCLCVKILNNQDEMDKFLKETKIQKFTEEEI